MPFPSLVCALIETSLNKLLSLDKHSEQRLSVLAGKVIKITPREYKQPLYFYMGKQRIEVLADFEGDVSVALALGIDTLIALKNQQNISELIKSDQLIIEGDIKALQQFADLLSGLDIDWTDILSDYTGDVVAHRVAQTSHKILKTLSQSAATSKHHMADYLKHEAKLAISPLEFIHFSDQVTTLHQQTERLALAIAQLEKS